MSLANYTDLQAALGAWLDHSIFAAQYPTFVTLFEATANRKLRVRQMEARTILYPSNPAPISITGAANNGSGLIRLTVTSTATVASAEQFVSGVIGTTEANGTWITTTIDGTHLDLQGSAFVNPYVSGGVTIGESGRATLPADYLTWRRVTWTGQTRNELGYVHPSYFQAAFPSQPTDVPKIFTIEGASAAVTVLKIMPLDPTPLEFLYYQQIPSLAANSTNWLMTAHPDVYLFGSMVEAEMFGVNDERMPAWKARRDEIFDEIVKLDTKTRGPSYVRVLGATP
jgi:hypothetical protein